MSPFIYPYVFLFVSQLGIIFPLFDFIYSLDYPLVPFACLFLSMFSIVFLSSFHYVVRVKEVGREQIVARKAARFDRRHCAPRPTRALDIRNQN